MSEHGVVAVLSIDAERCQGHGRCYDLAPGVFTYDDDGYAELIHERIGIDELDAARTATAACPERAIDLVESTSSEGE